MVGRSNIVGKPMALMLLERHATVTIAHSRTAGPRRRRSARADILVAAIGKAELVKGAWIKPGAVVIDVGMNRLEDGKLVGDVEYAAAAKRASAITPGPGRRRPDDARHAAREHRRRSRCARPRADRASGGGHRAGGRPAGGAPGRECPDRGC